VATTTDLREGRVRSDRRGYRANMSPHIGPREAREMRYVAGSRGRGRGLSVLDRRPRPPRLWPREFFRTLPDAVQGQRPKWATASRGSARPSPRSCIYTRRGSWPRITPCTRKTGGLVPRYGRTHGARCWARRNALAGARSEWPGARPRLSGSRSAPRKCVQPVFGMLHRSPSRPVMFHLELELKKAKGCDYGETIICEHFFVVWLRVINWQLTML